MAKRPTPDAARLKAQQMREEQARQDKRIRAIIVSIVVVIVVAVVGAVTAIIVNQQRQVTAEQSGAVASLGPYTDGAPIVYSHLGVGQADPDLPTLVEYFDYTCHACADIDTMIGPTISHYADKGTVNIEYQPVTTVGMAYQRPATSASIVVAQQAPEQWSDFHHALLAYFASEFKAGQGGVIRDLDKSVEQVKAIAQEVGVPADVIATFPEDSVEAYLDASTQAWSLKGFEGRDPNRYGTPEFINKDTNTVIALTGKTADELVASITNGLGIPTE